MKVFLTEYIHDDAVAMINEHGEVVQGTSIVEDDIIAQMQGCDAVLIRSAKITAKIMDAVPSLKVIAKHGIGVDNIDIPAATARGILIVNAPFANVNAVAEHGLALIMACAKHIVRMHNLTCEGEFKQRNKYITTELAGKTVGLVGLGRISSLLAKKLGALDVKIIASDPFVSAERAAELGAELVTFEELLAKADFVSLHTPLMDSTHHMMSTEQFKAMKSSAVLVNVSRGPVVDEVAMIAALKAGEIAGAGLDVFEAEPPQNDNELFTMPNVIVSPHNAALSDNAMRAMAVDAATGIIDYLEGRTPTWMVNKEVIAK